MYLVGIAGGSGSGKTTFAEKIVARVNEPISLIHMDSYYLPSLPKEHYTSSNKPNYDHPSAFDWELVRTHLLQLKQGNPIEAPVYDFKTSSRTSEKKLIKPSKVIIFEGIFSLFDEEIRNMLDILTFLHVEADIRFIRRLNRDVKERGRSLDSVINQYHETVRPMYQKFLAPQQQYADFIVGEETHIAASIMSAKINELLIQNDSDPGSAGLERVEHNKLSQAETVLSL